MIVYDDELVSQIDDAVFANAQAPAPEIGPSIGGGRSGVRRIRLSNNDWMLRHYSRGGLPRRISRDKYVWTGIDRTRSFREWATLAHLYAAHLPVPRPVAARAQQSGLLYTADLITERLPDVTPLSARLAAGPVNDETWAAIGAMIAQFHAAGADHADLNAHNIQISSTDRLYLLDFDRGRITTPNGGWTRRNLRRLHHSLSRLAAAGTLRFTPEMWQALDDGYRATRA